MVVELTAEQFAQRAFHLNLVTEHQLNEILSELGSLHATPQHVQQIMLRRDLLTNYQAERLLRGDHSGFFYGDYKVLYVMGTGAFARVFRATHRTSGDIVAVKVLRNRYCNNPEESERFYREGRMGATLRHPNIVPIYHVGMDSKTPYLAMEFVEGRNLREFTRVRGKFEPIEATRLAAEIASGLQYAASRGIHHRDLKLSNVLMSSRGQAKIVDFGLAAGEGQDDDMANPRTIDYAGLERITCVRKDDARSDIYFLGCMFYHMLCGSPPLSETRDRAQRMQRSRFTEVTPIEQIAPELPRAVINVVQRAMELDVHSRYQTPGAMEEDLKALAKKLADGTADVVEPAGPRVPPPPPTPQHSLMVVESNAGLQDIFRERLKSPELRVLMTRDPERALARFSDRPLPADCLLLSAVELGESALEAFNRLDQSDDTRQLPAILLLAENQYPWEQRANAAEHRVVLKMPLKLREVRETLSRLVNRRARAK